MLVPIQISGKEEIRISRCKHKKIFLENIKECNQDVGPGPKIFNKSGSDLTARELVIASFTWKVRSANGLGRRPSVAIIS